MSASKRVIIDKAQPGSQYQVGQSYLMPAIAADAFIKKGHGHEFNDKDWDKQQKAEKAAVKARKAAKAKTKAENKAKAERAKADAPMVDAKGKLAAIDARLADAEKRLAGANGKKRKEWQATVDAIKAERDEAAKSVSDLEPDAKPKIEMS